MEARVNLVLESYRAPPRTPHRYLLVVRRQPTLREGDMRVNCAYLIVPQERRKYLVGIGAFLPEVIM
jgi:hypothetical protein